MNNMAILKIRDNNGNIIEIPAIQGPKGDTGDPGESIGIADYEAGDDYTTVAFTNGDVIQIPSGVGIKNIRLTKESTTGNTYEIELTNGQSYDFVAPAGPTGKTGADGTSVTVSKVSESTEDGGSNIVLFSDGKELTVKNGSKGDKGDTPVKGTDYFTEADKEEIVNLVIAALPDGDEVAY